MKVYRYVTTLVKIPSNPNEVGIFTKRTEYNCVTQKDLLDVVNTYLENYIADMQYGVLNPNKYTYNESTKTISAKNEELENPDTYPPECVDLYRTNRKDALQVLSFLPVDDEAFKRVKNLIEPFEEYSGTLSLKDNSVYPKSSSDQLVTGLNRYLRLNLSTSFSELWKQHIGVVDVRQALISNLFNKL